ncbi:copper amine oxidase N-terminal domain-containing protein [Paenibacillus sp. S150]|uniref:copper amine oxidase N-terminal domain-containing protein n=1 Tax=Paenibacillus sp. S150 TaxID=2749826 RepID=UPI001C56BDE6|nr:copper amine oxidase N-terminal domain-containing protein [Paenibacillus sp. S150]MBW4083379.1 hypothetical protein [Paenibacillus sp. S150]
MKPVRLVVTGKKVGVGSRRSMNGKVMLPVGAVAESLGYMTLWDGGTKLTRNGKSLLIQGRLMRLVPGAGNPPAALN